MPGRPGRRSFSACRPAPWRSKHGLRRSVQTWAFLHDADETATSLRIESRGDGDSTSVGKDQFEVGLRGSGDRSGIGKDRNGEEVIARTGTRSIVPRGGLGRVRLVEVISEGGER